MYKKIKETQVEEDDMWRDGATENLALVFCDMGKDMFGHCPFAFVECPKGNGS